MRIVDPDGGQRYLRAHEVPAVAAADVRDQCVDLRLGGEVRTLHLRLIAQVEHWCPAVGHAHAEARVEPQPLRAQVLGDKAPGLSGRRPIRRGKPEILRPSEYQSLQKRVHDARQAPEVDGRNDAHHLPVPWRKCKLPRLHARRDGDAPLPRRRSGALGHKPALTRGGKIKNNSIIWILPKGGNNFYEKRRKSFNFYNENYLC